MRRNEKQGGGEIRGGAVNPLRSPSNFIRRRSFCFFSFNLPHKRSFFVYATFCYPRLPLRTLLSFNATASSFALCYNACVLEISLNFPQMFFKVAKSLPL
ncbi:MAG: hypothetical protein HFE32_04410 [Clostridia bacterium]|nr:hypothetical protein [Clostridia bacterium]